MKKVFPLVILALCLIPFSYGQSSDCSTLTILTESLPDFPIGHPVHLDIEAIGGTAPYTFTVFSGTLPAGLHLTPNGGIRGVPTEEIDTTVFITVTDANGCTLTQAYPFRVVP